MEGESEETNARIIDIKRKIAALFDAPALIDLRKAQLAVCYWQQTLDGPTFYTLVKIQARKDTSDGTQYALSSRSLPPYFGDLPGLSHHNDFSGTTKLFPATMVRALPEDLLNQPEFAALKEE